MRDFQHSDVVKMFQSSEELSITVLPSSVKTVGTCMLNIMYRRECLYMYMYTNSM